MGPLSPLMAAVSPSAPHHLVAAFDKKYKAAYAKLAGSLGKEELRRRRAQPPSSKAIDCRKSFGATLEC